MAVPPRLVGSSDTGGGSGRSLRVLQGGDGALVGDVPAAPRFVPLPGAGVEIQLGHLCNNRCVFCISGRLTHAGKAPLLDGEVVKARISEARAAGARKLTFLGGEPTAQPFFVDVVRHAVAEGFDELVLFTNGSMTGRTDLVDRIVALGGRFEWRFSFQGATAEAHERTTRRKGSFGQLVESLRRTHARGQKITVNMCVVAQNFESIPSFPELLAPYGVRQLHLDMFHPDDIGEATDEEILANIPRYSALAAPFEAVVKGFPASVDVRFGNLPYCVAPHLAPWIVHGGAPTQTVTVRIDAEAGFNAGWNKYEHKRRGKLKPESCGSCVFEPSCSGIASQYVEKFGADEFVPVTRARWASLGLAQAHWLVAERGRLRAALDGLVLPDGFERWSMEEEWPHAARVRVEGPGAGVVVRLAAPGPGATARTSTLGLFVERSSGSPDAVDELLAGLFARLQRPGDDVVHPPAPVAGMAPLVDAALRRLHDAAPFPGLTWRATRPVGDRVESSFVSSDDFEVVLWLGVDARGALAGGYRVDEVRAARSPFVRDGVESLLGALRRRR